MEGRYMELGSCFEKEIKIEWKKEVGGSEKHFIVLSIFPRSPETCGRWINEYLMRVTLLINIVSHRWPIYYVPEKSCWMI